VNLPGSVNGATENLAAVLHLIPHALDLLAGQTEHKP
jgi:molybdopterin biosynthesis enzyme MoaB